ncbi:MAG: SapC family protein [Pseudomonadota bacterium]
MTDNAPQLPLLYQNITPISAERHGGYGLSAERSYAFAAETGIAPLTIEEFTAAQRFFPIVFTREAPATPVALFGPERNRNDFVGEDGAWRDGVYKPAYLRRYPFTFVRRSAESEERVLCADMTSSHLEDGVEDEARALFKDGAAGKAGETAMEFCKAYELATARTQKALAELEERELFREGAIQVKIGDKTARIDGFRIIDETRLRELDDAFLARLARTGALGAIYAHLFSLANFSDLGGEAG